MLLSKVTQTLVRNPIEDVRAAVFRELDASSLEIPSSEIAITAGSRGIANIACITRAVGDWLKQKGAQPFIVPAMGSHNGATAEGQRAMIESLGITEEAMEMEIRASMDVVKIGEVASGEVFMDSHCYEAGAVFALNRIKLHTCFSGPVQSGIMKMLVVGMGKIRSAQTFHSASNEGMKEMLVEMGQVVLSSGRIIGALGILEDGYEQTAELHAIAPSDLPNKEVELLERHRNYFPSLPLDDLNVLLVGEIGKTYSGTGMDTNVIGYRGFKGGEDLSRPKIKIIAALDLAEASKGNAIGIGLADFTTKRCRDAIDERKTFLNVLTTGEMIRGKIPFALDDDEALVSTIRERFGDTRWMCIPNTLHLETLYVSSDLESEISNCAHCTISVSGLPLEFKQGRVQLEY